MKSSDIPDDLVIGLARRWREGGYFEHPGVVDALVELGIPRKLAYAKVERLIRRRLLECGVSPNFAWPR